MKPRPTRAELPERVRAVIVDQCGHDPNEVRAESWLIRDLGIDSLMLLELVMAIEEEFQISIPEKNENAEPPLQFVFTKPGFTVGDFVDLIYMLRDVPPGGPRPEIKSNRATPAMAAFTQFDGGFATSATGFAKLGENEPGLPIARRVADGMVVVTIPGNRVRIGNDELEIPAFAIDIEPVSTSAYARFLNAIGDLDPVEDELWPALPEWDHRGSHFPLERSPDDGQWRPARGVETWPMILVSWYGANAYALWANGADWRGYRETSPFLPTNTQFEYAARGPEPRQFPWGDEPDPDRANVQRHAFRTRYRLQQLPMAPVNACLGLSPFGLRHMAGNVWQWTADWHDPEQRIRCERGGSWIGSIELARCAYFRGRPPGAKGRCLGFRCSGPAQRD